MTATGTSTGSVVGVRVTGGRIADDVRGAQVVWKRELIRFTRSRIRILTSLAQPLLFLFILGTGLASVIPGAGDVDYRTFMFPGVLAMTVLFTAMFSSVSIVWDREFGFLREMLVAPVRRTSLVIGKCAGGGTVAAMQGLLMLAFAGLVGVPYTPALILSLAGMMLITALSITAFGIALASRITQVESFQMVMQLMVMPMFFLSGALFPLTQLPPWLRVLTRIDPLTYAVDPMRRAVIDALPAAESAHMHALSPGVTWGGWLVPIWLELVVLATFGVVALAVAAVQFNKTD